MWTGGAFPVAKPRAEAPVPRCVVGARGHAIAGNVWAPDRAGAALYSCSQTARPRLRRCAMWTNLNLVINEGSLPVWALVIFVGHHTRLQLHADRHWRQLRSVTSFSLRTQSSKKTVQGSSQSICCPWRVAQGCFWDMARRRPVGRWGHPIVTLEGSPILKSAELSQNG